MGCICSRLANRGFARNRRNSLNVFQVLNVDDMGRQISPGKIEVTETDLVLHVRGKPSLTWPLRCLRRYGYDNNLFSFESGRRCPTGAGIFAFRCTRAQSLFNLLQSKIQGNPTPNTVPSTPITPTNTCSNNPSTPVSSTFVYVNLSENNRQGNAPDVTQVHVPASQTVPTNLSMGMCTFPSFPSSQSQLLEDSHPLYMNVDGPALPHHSTSSARASTNAPYPIPCQKSQYYMNHERKQSGQLSRSNDTNNATTLYTNVICSPDKNDKVISSHYEPPEVNYAELDLKTENCSSSSTNPLFPAKYCRFPIGKENGKSNSKFRVKYGNPKPIPIPANDPVLPNRSLVGATSFGMGTPPNNGELGYATIDFDRTAALGVVTRSKINLDCYAPGAENHHDNSSARKTRHNSTAL